MNHDELIAAAERLNANSWDVYIPHPETKRDWMNIAGEILLDARTVASAYLAGLWSNDFAACPRDRLIEFLYLYSVPRKPQIDIGFHDNSRNADYWREFIPPTTKGEQS